MSELQLFEVFVRAYSATGHQHVGSVRAASAEEALVDARDLYTRRQEGVSLWVVASEHIHASNPEQQEVLFGTATAKDFRHPGFYNVPDGVDGL